MDYLLSVVLTTHNSEKYIEKFIRSIPNSKRVQFIIVDDGSSDKTVDTIRKYFPDQNIYCLIDRVGQSTSRQTGLNRCIGKYVWFVDPDDEILISDFASIESILAKSTSDIIQFSANIVNNNNVSRNLILQEGHLDNNVFSSFLKLDDFDKPYLWHRFYKLSFLKDQNIIFLNHHLLGEDMYFNLLAFSMAKTLETHNLVIYKYYLLNKNSITFNYNNKQLIMKYHAIVLCDALNKISDALDKEEVKLIYDFAWRFCAGYLLKKSLFVRECRTLFKKVLRTFRNNFHKNVLWNLIIKQCLLFPFNKRHSVAKNHAK